MSAQCLIVGMMHPDASVRITVAQSLEHPWLARARSTGGRDAQLDLAYDSLEPPRAFS